MCSNDNDYTTVPPSLNETSDSRFVNTAPAPFIASSHKTKLVWSTINVGDNGILKMQQLPCHYNV